jgi:uncharacterized membrane protein YccF (DUF307 family)
VFCSQCGTRLPQSARFCEECGAVQGPPDAAAVQTQVSGAAEAWPPGRPASLAYPAAGPPAVPAAQAIQFNPTINVTVASPQAPVYQAPPNTVVVAASQGQVPLVLRALWFLCVGLWLGAIWMTVAWLLNVTLIGLPLGLAMINRLPQVMTLQTGSLHTAVIVNGSTTVVTLRQGARQLPWLVRAVYFLTIGIWLSLVWMVLAYVAAALVVTLPVSFWMFNRVPAVTTLRIT